MLFDDWQTHKKETISKELLWEYDISAPAWDLQRMKTVVVARVLERGRVNDYYVLLQLYGDKDNVREIVKQVPCLEGRDRRWACVLSFFLVGGTALALQLGHRKSIDLDLFSQSPFDAAATLRNHKQDILA